MVEPAWCRLCKKQCVLFCFAVAVDDDDSGGGGGLVYGRWRYYPYVRRPSKRERKILLQLPSPHLFKTARPKLGWHHATSFITLHRRPANK